MRKVINSQAGFSLVELLIAVFIMAIGLLGLAQLQVTAIKANSHGSTIVAASNLAQKILEEVRAMDEADPIFDVDGNGTWAGSPFTVAGGGSYNVTYTVDTDFQGVSELCYVTITVESVGLTLKVSDVSKRTVTASTLKRST